MADNDNKKWRWFKLDWSAYEDATEHLTTAQHGAYFLLLKHYYKTGCALKPSHMPGIAKAHRADWNDDIWPALEEFFVLGPDGLYHNKRADQELLEREGISDERRKASQASHAAREANKIRRAAGAADAEQLANAGQMACTETGTVTEERAPPSEGGEPPPKMVQASLLEPADAPPSIEQMLWSEGLAIYARLSKKPPANCRSQLGDLAKIAGPETLLEVIRQFRDKPGKDSMYAWVKGCCETRKNQAPRLIVDNDPSDAWGIQAWCKTLPDVVPTETENDRARGNWMLNGLILDSYAKRVATAALLPRSWRGDWSALAGWTRDKIKFQTVGPIITARAERDTYDPSAVRRIAFFDDLVRGGKRSAA